MNHVRTISQRILTPLAAALCLQAPPAHAAWPSDALHPRLVCPSIGSNIGGNVAVPDGIGGAFVAWEDMRNGNIDPGAQHLRSDGELDPSWPALGRLLSLDPAPQQALESTPDGSGGVFVAWMDVTGDWDIHAQHTLAGGAIDPAWPSDGLPVSTAAGTQAYPELVSDGNGGLIIAWFDATLGSVWALHLLADGSRAPGWPENGRPLCAVAGSDQRDPRIITDGAGGAIVTWWAYEGAQFPVARVYAQHLESDGSIDVAWPADGLLLSPRADNQEHPVVIADGQGGAIVAWEDYRGNASGILAQHVLAGGMTDPAWPDSGRVLGTGSASWPAIAADGGGGAFVTWMQQSFAPAGASGAARGAGTFSIAPARTPLGIPERALRGRTAASYMITSAGGLDIYAQHVAAGGALDPAWPASGLPVSVEPRNQWFPVIHGDGAGNAFVAWQDFRDDTTGNYEIADVYLQHLRGGVGVDPTWPAAGLAPCIAPGYRYNPTLAGDGSNGVICTFADTRIDAPGLYAQHVLPTGQIGDELPTSALVGLVNAQVEDGCVRLQWNAPGAEGGFATIYRRTIDTDWRSVGTVSIDGQGLASGEDCSVEGGLRYAYRLGISTGGSETLSQASWVDTPELSASGHLRVRSPVQDGMLDATFALSHPRAVRVELFDVSGRRVASSMSRAAVGEQRVSLAPASSLQPGLYLVRLGLDHPVSARVSVIR